MARLLYIVAGLHVMLCPYTKVEESFNIQAFHDILYHRHNLSQYDHKEFPGVVPRSFIGPLIVSFLSSPVVSLFYLFGLSKFWTQYVVRFALALSVIGSWSRLRNTLQKQFGSAFTWWFTIITVSQYHFMFYMSRPLPNIMVLPLVLLAFDGWLSGKHKQFLISAGAGIIIFRSELAMLFGLLLLIDLYFKKIDITIMLKTVIPVGIGLIILTFIVDSIFWGRPLWPEAEVFWFNTILNKSSNWGTSPFLWYFYSALPRGLGPSLILIPVGIYLDKRMIAVAAPAFVYITFFSFLPHKELRFIIYVFPLLNMVSAAACSYIFVRRTKMPKYELLFWGTVVIIMGNMVLTASLTCVAVTNYPGGVAITRFHKLLKNEPFVHVHIDNLAAQTGVTRFTQYNNYWMYSKNESLEPQQMQEYTHLLIEAKSKYSPNLKAFSQTHIILDSIESFSQISLNYKLFPPIKIKTKPSVFILERKDFRDYPKGHIIETVDSEEYSERDSSQISSEETVVENSASDHSNLELNVPPNNEMEENNENVDIINNDETGLDAQEAKKAFDDLKSLRQERKRKAIAKIKSETRKEVVASAKEKLRDIMKRHQHIAHELSENIISEIKNNIEIESSEENTPILEKEMEESIDYIIPELVNEEPVSELAIEDPVSELANEDPVPELVIVDTFEMQPIEPTEGDNIIKDTLAEPQNHTDKNIDAIVEEVIARLIDRKIYDDKTKPEDIRLEDRQLIQQIVEEVVYEKMNYTSSNKLQIPLED